MILGKRTHVPKEGENIPVTMKMYSKFYDSKERKIFFNNFCINQLTDFIKL